MRYRSSGRSFISRRSLLSRRFLSSAAASFVNVTTIMRSALTPDSGSDRSFTSRSVSTAVLPLPAAAETIIDESLASMAFCCCLVQLIFCLLSSVSYRVFLLPFQPLRCLVHGRCLRWDFRRYQRIRSTCTAYAFLS